MFSFAKFGPTVYVIHYREGKVRREGRGLSFFYWQPTSSIVAVPLGTSDLPFVFNDVTRDFQTVTVQGQITYRVAEPKLLADMLDFTVTPRGEYATRDFEKIGQRIVNSAQTATSSLIATLALKEALRSADEIGAAIMTGLSASAAIRTLGIIPLTVSVVAVSPTPEMARALEAEAREALQQEADMAIYSRRNNAVAEERKIKESELNTEIAVEEKKRLIRETQTLADIAVEEQRKTLVEVRAANERKDAETRAFALKATLGAVADTDWKTLLALSGKGLDARVVIADAFRELSSNAAKIGTLNISPELLETLAQPKNRDR